MSVIPINAWKRRLPQPAATQPGVCAVDRIPHDNQHTRRSFLRMFILGYSVRKIASRTGAPERAIEQEIREALFTSTGPGTGQRKAA